MNDNTTFWDIETTDLQPWTGRIISSCFKLLGSEEINCITGENEKEILEKTISFFENNRPTLINFNIFFDLSFFRVRSVVNKVNCKILDNLLRIDLKLVLDGLDQVNKKSMRLGDYASYCNIQNNSYEVSGAGMQTLFINKEFEKIKQHNIADVKKVEILYQRLRECGIL